VEDSSQSTDEEQEQAGAAEDAEGGAGEERGGEDEELRVNDAVMVKWGKTNKPWAAVVTSIAQDGVHVNVQYDKDNITGAMVPASKVTLMPRSQGLQGWMRNGRPLEALDTTPGGGWWAADVVEARRDPTTTLEDGLRLWVRCRKGGECQWVKRHQVRKLPKPPKVSITVERVPANPVIPDGVLWMILSASTDVRLAQSTFKVSFGTHISPAELIKVYFRAASLPHSQLESARSACRSSSRATARVWSSLARLRRSTFCPTPT
jgi:hypothetical protein